MKPRSIKSYLLLTAAFLAAFGGYCAYLASQPDRELSFVREVPTHLPLETLQSSMESIFNWHSWFYSVSQAQREDLMGRPFPGGDQKVEKGALIRLTVQPHKGEKRGSFEFQVKVTDYTPGRLLEFVVVEDRALKMFKQFDSVRWRIEVLGDPPHTIRGTEYAHTRNARARVLTGLAERVVMNQLFYPNVMTLGEFTQPLPPSQYPPYGQ